MNSSIGTTLFLGPANSPLLDWLSAQQRSVVHYAKPIASQFLDDNLVTSPVSFGYRHILKGPMLERIFGPAVNLHISLLPWNRGADPNLWSFLEETPKGVSIHYLDEGIDTGDIIAQRELEFSDEETLATSYAQLDEAVQALFRQHWPGISAGTCGRRRQSGEGSFHTLADRDAVADLLTDG